MVPQPSLSLAPSSGELSSGCKARCASSLASNFSEFSLCMLSNWPGIRSEEWAPQKGVTTASLKELLPQIISDIP